MKTKLIYIEVPIGKETEIRNYVKKHYLSNKTKYPPISINKRVEIEQMYKGDNQEAIAEHFGISIAQVNKIINGLLLSKRNDMLKLC